MNEQTPKTNQSGHAVLFVMLGLAVAASGFFAWQYVQSENNKDSPVPVAIQQKKKEKEKISPVDPTEGGKYLVIVEWGVRFPVAEKLRGEVKYGIFTFTNGDQAAYLVSRKIAAHTPGKGCDLRTLSDSSGQGVYGGTIALSRSETKPEEGNQESFYHSSGYWYTVGFANGGACYEGDTGQEKGEFNLMIDEAVKSLESVKS